jgi:plasmid stabilization system protein ParE
MKVYWTLNAIRHLTNIYEYIGLNSPTYARRMVHRITRRSEQISAQPLSGRKVPEYEAEDIRELIEKPFRIIYRESRIKSMCWLSSMAHKFSPKRLNPCHNRSYLFRTLCPRSQKLVFIFVYFNLEKLVLSKPTLHVLF